MIYDRQWFLDVRKVLDNASVLKESPPQNVVKPAEKPVEVETHMVYDYADGAFADYSCWAAMVLKSNPLFDAYGDEPWSDV